MNSQGHKWLTNTRTDYQGLLCENPRVCLETVWMLNPATYLPTEMGTPNHNCKEVTEEIYLSRPDLMDTPLQNLELFTDGSSFIQDGQRKAGYAVMTTDEIVMAEALPQGWSAQRAEPWALIQVLRHAQGTRVNIYTESTCAFATFHVHGAINKGATDRRGRGCQKQRNPSTVRGSLEAFPSGSHQVQRPSQRN